MAASLTAYKKLSVLPSDQGGLRGSRLRIARVVVGLTASGVQPNYPDVVVDAQATYQVVFVPKGTWIAYVATRIITAFTAATTMTIGDGDAAAGWLASAKIAPTVAETVGKFTSTIVVTQDGNAGGKKYLADDTIDLVIAGATPLVGLMEWLIAYDDVAVKARPGIVAFDRGSAKLS